MAALALINGGVSHVDLQADRLAENATKLYKIAEITTVAHDPALTEEAAASFENILPSRSVVADAGLGRLLRAGIVLGRDRPQGLNEWEVARVASRMATGVVRKAATGSVSRLPTISSNVLEKIRKASSRIGRGTHDSTAPDGALDKMGVAQSWWNVNAIDSFTMAFPSRVIIRMKDGSELVAKAEVPRGAAGNLECGPTTVAREKLATCTDGYLDSSRLDSLDSAIVGNGNDLATYLPQL